MKQPIIIKVPCTKELKRKSKDGLILKYKCPNCPYTSQHKKRVQLHMIKSCDKKQQQKDDLLEQPDLQQHLIYEPNEVIEHIRNDQVGYGSQSLKDLERRVKQIQLKVQPASSLNLTQQQTKNYQALNYLVDNIMKQSHSLCTIIKSNLLSQVNELLLTGFKVSDIFPELLPVVIKCLQNIDFMKQFSTFKKNIMDFENYLYNQYKNEVEAEWFLKIKRSWLFLKKYKQNDFVHQHKIVQDLLQLKSYKRELIFKVYNKMINLFSQKFPYRKFPSRLIKKSATIFKHRTLALENIRGTVLDLIKKQKYVLATDVWMAVTIGLRSREIKKIMFNKDDKIVDFVKIFEFKNRNITNRVVPNSLRYLMTVYNIKYPMSNERFLQVKNFCLKQFKAFYGLRSLCITTLIDCLLSNNELAKFHKRSNTTVKYYLNTESISLINNIFKLPIQIEIQKSGFTIYFQENNQTEFIRNQQTVENYLDSNDTQDIVYQNERDSISVMSINELKMAIQNNKIDQEESNQLKFQKFKLDNDIQINQQQFGSITQALLGEDIEGDQPSQTAQISSKCEKTIKVITYQQDKPWSQENYGSVGGDSIIIIKRRKNKQYIYKVEDKQINKTEMRQKYHRSTKNKKTLRQLQNLPQLQTKMQSCLGCGQRDLKIIICQKNIKHSMIVCQKCDKVYHKCIEESNLLNQSKLVSTYTSESILYYQSIKCLNVKNNLSQVMKNQERNLIKTCLIKNDTPLMKCSFPRFGSKFKREIIYNRNHECFLPLKLEKINDTIGYGVFATTNINANKLVCCYNGVIGTNNNINFKHDSLINIGWVKDNGLIMNVGLEADRYSNIGRYLNSVSNKNDDAKNCEMVIGLIDGVGSSSEIVFLLYSIKQIEQGQQLLWFYGDSYWKDEDDELQNNKLEDKIDQQPNILNQKSEQDFNLDINNQQQNRTQIKRQLTKKNKKKLDINKEKSIRKRQNKFKLKRKIQKDQKSDVQLKKEILHHDQIRVVDQIPTITQSIPTKTQQPSQLPHLPTQTQQPSSQLSPLPTQTQSIPTETQQPSQLPHLPTQTQQPSSLLPTQTTKMKRVQKDITERYYSYGIYSKEMSIVFNQTLPCQIASIVKIFVFLYCQKQIQKGSIKLEDKFKMPLFEQEQNYTKCGIKCGQQCSLQGLLHGMLIASGCQAAYSICHSMALRKNIKINQFLEQLNQLVKQLKLYQTTIRDCTGLGNSTSTVQDLGKVLKILRQSSLFKKIIKCQSYNLKLSQRTVNIKTTNQILGEKIYGKTGNGRNALFCFAGFKQEKKDTYDIIVLGGKDSNKRFDQCKKLLFEIKKMK